MTATASVLRADESSAEQAPPAPRTMDEAGLPADRVELRGWAPDYLSHLRSFNDIDIALDCFPYPGITTSMEALLMGPVP